MIESSDPETWRGLEKAVFRILSESGLEAETPKPIKTVRGTVEIDVFATDKTQKLPIIYLCECKHWKTTVPQTVVHSLQTVVSNYGANFGLIISSNGFQSGAYEAAQHSNVLLLTWIEFQELFEERWFLELATLIRESVYPLIEYTEEVNSRVFRKADALTPEAQEMFGKLRYEYANLAYYAFKVLWIQLDEKKLPDLPLTEHPNLPYKNGVLSDELLNAVALRDFLDILLLQINKGLKAFDEVFGGRV